MVARVDPYVAIGALDQLAFVEALQHCPATLSCQPLRHDAFSTTGSGQMLSSFSCSSVKKRSGPLLLVVSFQVEALSSESQTPVTRWCGLLLSVLPWPQKSSRPRCGPCRSCSPPPPAPREDAHKQPRTDDNKRPTHDVKERNISTWADVEPGACLERGDLRRRIPHGRRIPRPQRFTEHLHRVPKVSVRGILQHQLLSSLVEEHAEVVALGDVDHRAPRPTAADTERHTHVSSSSSALAP